MERVDYAHLAVPLDGDDPAGVDLEYDPDFLNIEKALRPVAPGMIADSDQSEGDPVDWGALHETTQSLAEKTRDLRLAMRLARLALMDGAKAGLPVFAASLELSANLLDGLWGHVYPRLDEDDNMDATMRLNAFGDLEDPRLLNALLDVTVARAGRMSVTLRDVEIAKGRRDVREDEDEGEISGRVAAVFNVPREELSIAAEAAKQGVEALQRIRSTWADAMDDLAKARADEDLRFTALPPPQVEALEKRLADIIRGIGEWVGGLDEGIEAVEGGQAEIGNASGRIGSRVDAERQIVRIIEWFRKNEPSSPVPALLERARSMISKSFLEIIDELGEGGINEARRASQGSAASEDATDE